MVFRIFALSLLVASMGLFLGNESAFATTLTNQSEIQVSPLSNTSLSFTSQFSCEEEDTDASCDSYVREETILVPSLPRISHFVFLPSFFSPISSFSHEQISSRAPPGSV